MTTQNITSAAFLRPPGKVERILVVVMLFTYSFSLPNEWFIVLSDAEATGGPLVQATFLGFFGIAVLGINGNWHVAAHAAAREPLIPALLGFAALSTLWSSEIGLTFTTVAVLGITYVVGIYIVLRFSIEEFLFLLGLALAAGIFVNFVMIFVFPSSGLQNTGASFEAAINDAWSGVFRSRNTLARFAVLSFVTFSMNARLRRSFFIWPALAVRAVIQVIGTGSATSLGALLAVIGLSVVLLGFRGRKNLYGATAIAMFTIFSAVTTVAALNVEAATALVGRDSTFTGRLPLWQASINYGIVERPWLGHGWGAFWAANNSFQVQIRSNFNVPHAHNAFVDTWLFLGPVGSALLVAIYARGLFWAARNIRRNPTITGLFPAIAISLSVLYSLSESGFVNRSSAFILLVVASTIAAQNKGVQQPFIGRKPEDINPTKEQVLV